MLLHQAMLRGAILIGALILALRYNPLPISRADAGNHPIVAAPVLTLPFSNRAIPEP